MKVASLFAGCGGADLGIQGDFKYLGKTYTKRNLEFIHVSDIDAKAVATYNLNFAHQAEVQDVRNVSLSLGACDILVGGFPCQSFSSVNPTKDPNDDRGQLFWELVRIADEAKPKVVIAENVRGFYSLHKGQYFHHFMDAMEKIGYDMHHAILAANEFGVPQRRQRVFMVGFRKDMKINFKFPTVDSAASKDVPLKRVIKSLTDVPEKYYFSERAVQGVKAAKPNMKRAVAQDLDQPCLTITSHLAKASLNSRDPVLLVDPVKEIYRRFTPEEASLIQGFPSSFKWQGSDPTIFRQIGNAISPVVMWWLFDSVMNALKDVD